MQFKAFEKDIEVNGQTVYSIVDGLKTFKVIASKFLLQEGLGEKGNDGLVKLDLNSWYSQESWLKAFENISKNVGDSILFQIGLSIPENAKFPPFVKDIETAIQAIDIAYHINHRKNGKELFDQATGVMSEGIGHYGFEKAEKVNKIISVCNNPYPCDFDRGIITAMAKKFQPKAVVVHDNSKPCRKKGDDNCTYIVTW